MMDQPPRFLPPPPQSAPSPPIPSPVEASERQVIRWGTGDVLIGLLLWLLGGIIAAVVLLSTATRTDGDELGLGVIAVSVVAGWPGFLGWPVAATWFKGQRSLAKDFGMRIRPVDIGWGALGGMGALLVSTLAGVMWRLLSDAPEPSNAGFLPSRPSAGTALALLLLVAVCTPIVEELFFRGLFLRAVGRRWGLPVGVVASSIVFGLMHYQGGGLHGLFISAVTASYGAVFAVLVIRAGGRLGPSIVAHMVVNGVGVIAALSLG